jgi:uncharacterized protein YbbK (DUF523 family)
MKKILVSACLCGDICRWHAKKAHIPTLVRQILKNEQAGKCRVFKACPEMLGGLPCPRPPVKTRKGRIYETCADKKERKNVTGKELTNLFLRGAERVLEIIRENKINEIILCDFSPSCARNGVLGKLLTSKEYQFTNIF